MNGCGFARQCDVSVGISCDAKHPAAVPTKRCCSRSARSVQICCAREGSCHVPSCFHASVSFGVRPDRRLALLARDSVSVKMCGMAKEGGICSVCCVPRRKRVGKCRVSVFKIPVPFVACGVGFWRRTRVGVWGLSIAALPSELYFEVRHAAAFFQ